MTPIVIGRVVSPFGNKGELKVYPLTDWICRYLVLDGALILKEGKTLPVSIENAWYHRGHVILKVTGIDDIGGAERVRGSDLAVDASDLVPLPSGHFWVHEIVGLKVLDEAGASLGVVTEVLKTGANDVYVLDSQGRQVLIPATHEVVKEINTKRGYMIIRPLPGMLE